MSRIESRIAALESAIAAQPAEDESPYPGLIIAKIGESSDAAILRLLGPNPPEFSSPLIVVCPRSPEGGTRQ